jgi:osmotically-inducible protein OsmY
MNAQVDPAEPDEQNEACKERNRRPAWKMGRGDTGEQASQKVVSDQGTDRAVRELWQRIDPEVARDAVPELESHVSIPADRIKVTVKDGWVTLEGTVDWEFQKILAKSRSDQLYGRQRYSVRDWKR